MLWKLRNAMSKNITHMAFLSASIALLAFKVVVVVIPVKIAR